LQGGKTLFAFTIIVASYSVATIVLGLLYMLAKEWRTRQAISLGLLLILATITAAIILIFS
jgi:hypothetical protein